MLVSQTNSYGYGVTNAGFSKGVHYFELYFPESAENFHIGFIKKGADEQEILTSKWNPVQFRTNYPTVVNVKLDFESLSVNYWVNGNLVANKATAIL